MMRRFFSLFIYSVVAIIVIGAVTVFATTLTHALIASPHDEQSPSTDLQPTHMPALATEYPVRIIIPKIGVDALIQDVGISKRGNMAVPTSYSKVGWYRYGARPGQAGTAVLAGHLDNGFGLPAVFNHLSELTVGDQVIIEDAEGVQYYFVVKKIGVVDYVALDTDDIFGDQRQMHTDSAEAHLNLITCEGDWDSQQKIYTERRIVFTTLTDVVEPIQ
jgi:sortase (surface protein transpeptidase)